uniref:Uncharacterized protein n=1 Tax=Setaria italica TaxID=4555 RepID=K3ZBU6_SETIT
MVIRAFLHDSSMEMEQEHGPDANHHGLKIKYREELGLLSKKVKRIILS